MMDLGDRMKMYEKMISQRLMPRLPVVIRLDGKAFHSFTKGLERPYDLRLVDLMQDLTIHLVKRANARIGYTQSDEINLILYSDDEKTQIYFDGKIQKIVSVLAAEASVFFNQELPKYIPEKSHITALFDCRVHNVPTKIEAVNYLIWREQDATRNSVSIAAQSVYNHNQLMNKNNKEKLDMLIEKRINWNDYASFFKRGTYIQNRTVLRRLSCHELSELPEKHEARKNPNMKFERKGTVVVDIPPLTKVLNSIEVVFDGEVPTASGG